MRIFGLIGFPLSHSFSKKYFSEKFEKTGIRDCRYENFPIASLDEIKTILSIPGIEGLNITIPYKEAITAFLHESSDVVKTIKACNCIKIKKGVLYGYNTDVTGFEKAMEKKRNPDLHNHALVLGAGGSARAVKYVLEKMGVSYKTVSRKPAINHLSYEQLTEPIIDLHTLIINTTPLGMFPNVIEAPQIPYEFITSRHLLFDLIYNPEKTLFLNKGEERGAAIQNGYEMLTFQAEENWEIWNDPDR